MVVIYFDFNLVIMINIIFYIIGCDFILVEVGEVLLVSVLVQVFFNFFVECVIFVVEGVEQCIFGFVLYDVSGCKVLSDYFVGNSYELDGIRFFVGVYFY